MKNRHYTIRTASRYARENMNGLFEEIIALEGIKPLPSYAE